MMPHACLFIKFQFILKVRLGYRLDKMRENIEISIKNFDWRSQAAWEVNIPDILAKIETWLYRSKPVEIDLECIDLWSYNLWISDLYDAIVHFKIVEKADLQYPVIVNHKGVIIDGRHRLCKAVMLWHTTIKWIMLLDNVYNEST